MRNIMCVFGTRPEAIKMCPVICELFSRENIKVVVCNTGQHREMLNPVLKTFHIAPDYDMKIMKDAQDLFDITTNIMGSMRSILEKEKPDIVLVHGDTTTAFLTSVACYYAKIPVGHVEAGLRTYDIHSPYPEEFNRQAIDIISEHYFAPTEEARQNLLAERKEKDRIYVTGNTGIDALKYTVSDDYKHPELEKALGRRFILMTAHRRENIGEPMKQMFRAVRRICEDYRDILVIYPIHMNPAVRSIAEKEIGGCPRIHMIEPLDVIDFHNFLARCYFVLTDSGGVQEEAPSFGKPVLVMRNQTERPEGIKAGVSRLVGTDEEGIYENIKLLLDSKKEYEKMSQPCNPYGDGRASSRIADILISTLG